MTRRPLFLALTGALIVGAGITAAGAAPPAARAATTSQCGDVSTRPWCNTALSPDARADLLLAQLTTDEKIMLMGGNTQGESPHTGAQYAITRLGIPTVYYSDGPVGPRQGSATAMPIPEALAATFDQKLAFEHGAEIATEAKDKGNDVVFAPTTNIARNPQGGRSYETYGEEPFLTSRTTVGWIDGAQSTGVIADVKHFAANNQEGQDGVPPFTGADGSRLVVNVQVDERVLRELYFPHFESAVKQADVGTLMCSYNMVNGTYSCENAHDTQQVLERDWGYKGIVLSDYGAAHDTGPSLTNGLDFEPSGLAPGLQSYNPAQIQAALATGMASQTDVDNHVHRILRTMFAYGVFDRAAYVNDDAQINKPADDATAERIEEQAITLLKNADHTLPISSQVKSIAVIGPYADQFVTGGGSGTVSPFSVVTALAGIRARVGPGVTVTYADGSDQAASAAAAKAADLAVVVVGDVETEGNDKSCIDLNCNDDVVDSQSVLLLQNKTCATTTCPLNGTDEDGLITAVAAANPKTVVVLETGAPVLTPWRDSVAAVIEAWYPGQEGGTALARVLFGDVDPGGRLPVTFPAAESQLPTYGNMLAYPGVGAVETYSEGLDVGYRWYDDHNFVPAYGFGEGMSYSTFSYSDLTVTAGTPGSQDTASVTATVTNTGSRPGFAVPELYLSKPATAALTQPAHQLEGYQKLSLAPGQSQRVTFSLNDRSFASWLDSAGTTADPSGSWVIPAGCYGVAVGNYYRDLPLTSKIGQGTSCGANTVRLDSAAPALSSLPLPNDPTVAALAGGPATVVHAPQPAAKKPVTTRRRHATGVKPRPRATQPTRTLAFTGLDGRLGVLACVAVAAGLATNRRTRRRRA